METDITPGKEPDTDSPDVAGCPAPICSLLPCPFCGEDGEIARGDIDPGMWQAGCSSPNCCAIIGEEFENPEDAASRWNSRSKKANDALTWEYWRDRCRKMEAEFIEANTTIEARLKAVASDECSG